MRCNIFISFTLYFHNNCRKELTLVFCPSKARTTPDPTRPVPPATMAHCPARRSGNKEKELKIENELTIDLQVLITTVKHI